MLIDLIGILEYYWIETKKPLSIMHTTVIDVCAPYPVCPCAPRAILPKTSGMFNALILCSIGMVLNFVTNMILVRAGERHQIFDLEGLCRKLPNTWGVSGERWAVLH